MSLTDDDGGTALFSVTDMVPGDTETACIEVTYTGSIVGADLAGLNLYGASSGALAAELDLDVQRSAAGGSCAAFASAATVYSGALSSLGTDFATGAAGLTPGTSAGAQLEAIALDDLVGPVVLLEPTESDERRDRLVDAFA